MLGELNEKQIESVLTHQIIGRLACHCDDQTYLVPLNYVYRDRHIYAHSGPGKKIDMMRKNPKVCFEVEELDSIFKWKCVIAWGTFEEIIDVAEKERARQLLTHRLMPFMSQPCNHPWHGIASAESDIDTTINPIVYRIKLSKITGRFEDN